MKDQILKLRNDGKSYNQIVNILGCSKGTVSYHCTRMNKNKSSRSPSDDEILEFQKLYDKYGTTYEVAKHTKWSVSTIKKYVNTKREHISIEEKKKRNVIAVKKRRKKIKELAVEYKGGSCKKCGYKKYIGALEFHHLDPNKKDFSIGNKGYTRSWDNIKKELDKCILVCSNCHKEIHAELNE